MFATKGRLPFILPTSAYGDAAHHDGVVRAYLNVCAHRHAKLTSKPFGRARELVCQYHGWRYAPDRTPCHVPQAE